MPFNLPPPPPSDKLDGASWQKWFYLLRNYLANTIFGTVTSVDVSGGTTGLTSLGGPITTSGTITLSGTVNATHGGTGLTSFVVGDMLYSATTNTLSRLPVGTDGRILKVVAGIPTWSVDTGTGTVTSVDVSGGTTGMTFSGGPITSSGTITMSGTLDVDNGGTGQSTYTNGQLLIGNTTGNTLTKATLTQGTGITITNGAGSITIAATGTGFTSNILTADTTVPVDNSYIVMNYLNLNGFTLTLNGQVGVL